MIRKVEVIFRKRGVWARGSTYGVVATVPHRDGEILFSKEYPKKTPVEDIWDELRSEMTDFFFDIFYPSVVEFTAPPEPPSPIPDIALSRQSKYIRERQTKLPEYYEWNPALGKWHMTEEGYRDRTISLGEGMDIGISEEPFESMYDFSLLNRMQERFKGETRSIILFVYPDRYDDEVRALFELRVTFW